jgi:hypothetical protein
VFEQHGCFIVKRMCALSGRDYPRDRNRQRPKERTRKSHRIGGRSQVLKKSRQCSLGCRACSADAAVPLQDLYIDPCGGENNSGRESIGSRANDCRCSHVEKSFLLASESGRVRRAFLLSEPRWRGPAQLSQPQTIQDGHALPSSHPSQHPPTVCTVPQRRNSS